MDGSISEEKLRNSIDIEVKRMSEVMRFILRYQKHFQPSGVEFSGLRQYLPSDDASRIDWKNSAGKPDLYVKEYDEEVNLDVFIILDVSDTMTFGTAEKLKSEYAAIISASITYASVDVGIDVGFGIWGENNIFITPGGGDAQYQKILHEVVKPKNYGGDFSLEKSLKDVIGQIKENTAVFIISDFINVGDGWSTKMRLASKKYRGVTCIMVRDLRDYKMPDSGNIRLKSPKGESITVNTSKVKSDFDAEARKQEEMIEEKVLGSGADFIKLDTRDSFAGELAGFFEDKRGGGG